MKNFKQRRLYLQVYDELKKYIAESAMKPGDRLPPEMSLAESLGVSRNVLREALKALEITGVISSHPGVGMVLNSFSSNFLSSCIFLNLVGDGIDLVEQTQEVRKALELGFAKPCFIAMTDAQVERLEAYLKEMEETEDIDRLYDIDMLFHRTMYENLHNDVLLAFMESAWACEKNYHTHWMQDKQLTYKKHKRIVTALKEHDYDEFIKALQYHYGYNFKRRQDAAE